MDRKSDLLRAVKEERVRRALWEAYRKDPLFWLEDRFGEPATNFYWSKMPGYEGHNWDADVDPLRRAWESLADGHHVGIEAATGTSKTYWLARVVIWFLDCWDGSLVVTSAPKQDQLKLNLWSEIGRIMHKVKRIRPKASLYNLRLVMDDSDADQIVEDEAYMANTWHAVGFVAGVGAEEQSANKARGFHRKDMLIIMEECPGMPLPVMTAFQNTSSGTHNLILAVGNPDHEFDPLHQFCSQADVKSYQISAYDYPNVVLKKEIFPGGVTPRSIENRRSVYGSASPLFNAMVRGISPKQSQDSLIHRDWIEQCVDYEIPEELEDSYSAVGVDVANSESGDRAAVAAGRRNTMTYLKEFACRNATHLAYNLIYDTAQLNQHGYNDYELPTLDELGVIGDCVGVDAVGVGVATLNAFHDKGVNAQALLGGQWDEAIIMDENEKPLYRFQNLRSQMYWELREDLRKKQISISIANKEILPQVMKELVNIRFDSGSAYIKIESKDTIKSRIGKSPNLADAIAYWNWARKGYRFTHRVQLPITAGS